MDDEMLLSSVEAARFLRMQPQTLREWRSRGCSPSYVRLGHLRTGRVYYRRADLEAWLAARTFASTAEEQGDGAGR